MAYWKPDNLEHHYRKHPAGKDEKCWMDLLNTTTQVEETEYEAESKKVISTAWIVYRAEELDVQKYWPKADQTNPLYHQTNPPYHEEGLYYTDARLIRTITNVRNGEIRTCYHEHFDRPHEPGSGSVSLDIKRTEAKLKYIDRLIKRRGPQLRGIKIEKTDDKLPKVVRLKIEELKR